MTKQEAIDVLADTPYLRKPNGDADTEYANAIDIAIKCIEKQIPKKPTLGGTYKINEWECPNCKSYFAELNDRPRHCAECGQRIDWSDDE